MVGIVTCEAIVGSRRITGLLSDLTAELVSDLSLVWHERHQARLVSRSVKRTLGASTKQGPVFINRLLATLIRLRHG
ncbi:hypothetical protein [Streptomyces sp. NPDC055607]